MKRKWLENPGGGISRIEELTPEGKVESENGTATEGGSTETVKPKKIQTSSAKKKSTLGEKKGVGNSEKQMVENGQTLLDVSKGDIRITKNGAAGG